jgi:hypothetical protein
MVDDMNAALSPMRNSLDSLSACFDSLLSTPSCTPTFNRATVSDLRQRFQQVKQTACDLQKDLADLNNADPGNPTKFESDRKAMVQRMDDFSNRNRELIALLNASRSLFSTISGFGAAGGRGAQGTGGQSSQGGAGQTNAGGSIGGTKAGGGTQNGAGGQSAAGSSQPGNQSAAGSTQSGGQSAAGSSQAGNQSAAGSSQAGNQSATGSSQAGNQSATGSSQAGNQGAAGSSQSGGQSAAGSSQSAGSGATNNSGEEGSLVNVSLSENPQDGTTNDSVTVGSAAGGGTGVPPLVDVQVGTP